ncbi:MAG: hypothetical protein KKF44_08140 [Nanoarchaeota archaeon]|nr:hypothetical protein [Nanoarchaeota archaeon]
MGKVVFRKFNIFEKILVPIGFFVTGFGFYMLMQADAYHNDIAWLRLIAIFNWLILLLHMVSTAANEDMKEELSLIQKEHVDEIRLLRDINHDLLEEMKLLRIAFLKKKK